MKKTKHYFAKRYTVSLVGQFSLIALILAIPVVVYLAQQQTALKQQAASGTVFCPVTGHQVGPQGFQYNECTNAKSWCARQFGLLRDVHVLEHQDCSYTCTDNGRNCNGGTGKGISCPVGACGTGQICDNNTGTCKSNSSNNSSSSSSSSSSSTGSSSSSSSAASSSSGSSSSSGNSSSSGGTGVDTASVTVDNSGQCKPTGTQNDQSCGATITVSNNPDTIAWGLNSSGNVQNFNATSGTFPANKQSSFDVTFTEICSTVTNNNSDTVTFSLSNPSQPNGTQPVFVNSGSQANNTSSATVLIQCGSSTTIQVQFAITGLVQNPVHTSKNFLLLLTPVNGGSTIKVPGVGAYNPATGLFTARISLLKVLPGQYRIVLHVDGTLDVELLQPDGSTIFVVPKSMTNPLTINAGSSFTPPVNLTPGDVGPGATGDDFIDIIDYNKLIGCIGKAPTGICASSDLNDDGRIDDTDLNLLLSRFGSLGFSLETPQFTCTIDPTCNSGQQSLQLCTLVCSRQ